MSAEHAEQLESLAAGGGIPTETDPLYSADKLNIATKAEVLATIEEAAANYATAAQGMLAETAYQTPSGGIPAEDMAEPVREALELAGSAYQKPEPGIPAEDLAEDYGLDVDLAGHAGDTILHVSQTDRERWDAGGAGGGIATETDPIYSADKAGLVTAGGLATALDDYAKTADVSAGFAAEAAAREEADETAAAERALLAALDSPEFVGTPKAPTAAIGTATTQVATTEFVATAIEEADGAPSAAFAMVPDYAVQDSTNQMPADGSSFTVPGEGFVVVSRDGDAAARQSVMVDGVEAAGATGSVSVTLPVSAGDVVSAAGTGWTAGSCYYVPPKYVPVNRGYSTDEQLTAKRGLMANL